MLSITNNQQLNFRRNDNKVTDSDVQKYEKVQDELDCADSFVIENIEQTKPKHINPVSKFFRNIVLGTALIGGATATQAVEAQTQNQNNSDVIVKEQLINPKNPSQGKGTYYYTQEAVMDSTVSDYGKSKRIQKFDRKLLNTFPKMKYSYKNIQPGHSFIYSYGIEPNTIVADWGFILSPEPELKTLSGKKIVDYQDDTVLREMTKRAERSSENLYTPAPKEEPFFNNPALQDNVVKKGNQIIKSGRFVDDNTNEAYTVTAYYTERPVLDSVIVKKPNGEVTTTRLDRDVDLKSVTHVGRTNSDGSKTNLWLNFDNNNFIKDLKADQDDLFYHDVYTPIEPTPSRKK